MPIYTLPIHFPAPGIKNTTLHQKEEHIKKTPSAPRRSPREHYWPQRCDRKDVPNKTDSILHSTVCHTKQSSSSERQQPYLSNMRVGSTTL